MRTNIFNEMTAREIETYLASGKDAIFIAIGSTGAHGNLPVNADTVMAEGLATVLAEKSGALVLTGLPYFYPGEAVISSATVYTSLRDGYEYLWKIMSSLIHQGFKKLFVVPSHENIAIMLRAFTRDFFEATHYHPIVIDLMSVLSGAVKHDRKAGMSNRAQYEMEAKKRLQAALPYPDSYERLICGAYKIMGKENQLIVDPEVKNSLATPLDPEVANLVDRAKRFGGTAAEMYDDPSKITTGIAFTSIEERDQVCAEYEKKLRDTVDAIDVDLLLKVVGDYQEYALGVCEVFPRFNKLAENR